jgi:hypothetical protein
MRRERMAVQSGVKDDDDQHSTDVHDAMVGGGAGQPPSRADITFRVGVCGDGARLWYRCRKT